jgi:hypothetical protein
MTLVEIVGCRAEPARRTYGVVIVDDAKMNSWAVVALEAARDTEPELRFYPRGGLTRVASAADGFELQLSPRDVDRVRQGRLVARIQDALPAIARRVADVRVAEPQVSEVFEVEDDDLVEELDPDADSAGSGFVRALLGAPLALARRLRAFVGAEAEAEPESPDEEVEARSWPTIQEPRRFPASGHTARRVPGPVSVELLSVETPASRAPRRASTRRTRVVGGQVPRYS